MCDVGNIAIEFASILSALQYEGACRAHALPASPFPLWRHFLAGHWASSFAFSEMPVLLLLPPSKLFYIGFVNRPRIHGEAQSFLTRQLESWPPLERQRLFIARLIPPGLRRAEALAGLASKQGPFSYHCNTLLRY
jgi:hypothetical protein